MEATNREDSRRICASTRGKDQTLVYRLLLTPIGSACDSANAAPFSVGHEHDRMWARSSSSALGGVERSASQATKIMAPAFRKTPPRAASRLWVNWRCSAAIRLFSSDSYRRVLIASSASIADISRLSTRPCNSDRRRTCAPLVSSNSLFNSVSKAIALSRWQTPICALSFFRPPRGSSNGLKVAAFQFDHALGYRFPTRRDQFHKPWHRRFGRCS